MPLTGKRLLIVGEDRDAGRLVALAAEQRGARVNSCATLEEALEALRIWPADAAVLDLPLGGGDPAPLCERLLRDAVRVLAIAATPGSPRVAAEAERLRAARVFAKPFAVGELLSALGRALSDAPPAPAPTPTPSSSLAPGPDFESLIFSWARPALDESVPVAFGRARTEPLASPLPGSLPAVVPGAAPRLLPRGSLEEVLLPRLLAVLALGQATGSIELVLGPVRRLLLLDRGAPAFAISNQPHERFGPRCVREGVLDPGALASLQRSLPPGESLGRALVARGLLGAERRREMVAAQVSEIAWAAFPWRQGSYRIALGPLPSRERLDLGLLPGPFILRGVQEAFPLEQLRQELPPDCALAASERGRAFPGLGLSPAEQELLALADGTKSIADLLALSPLAERDSLALLLGARLLGHLGARDRVLASTRRMGFM